MSVSPHSGPRSTRNDVLNLNVQYEKTKYNSLQFLAEYAATAGPATRPTTACAVSNIQPVPNSPFNSANVDCSGFPVTFSPEWIVNAGYNHIFRLNNASTITAAAFTQIQSSFWLADEYIPAERQKPTMVSDVSLAWTSADGHLTLTAYVNNIENKQVGGSSFLTPGGPAVYLAPPRTYGARLNVHF